MRLVAIAVAVLAMTGCFSLTRELAKQDTTISIRADCDDDTVYVDLNEEVSQDGKGVSVEK